MRIKATFDLRGEQIQGSASCASRFGSWLLLQHPKMTLMMKTCFFPLAILFLWQVQDGAEACTCVDIQPQQVFCRADMVFSAFVSRRQFVNDHSGNRILKYDVQVIKVYKGTLTNFDAVYTSSSDFGACGATLETTGQHYVLTGSLGDDGAVHTTMCDFHVLLYELTDAQKRDLNLCMSHCIC